MGVIQDVALAMIEGNSTLRGGNLIFERSLARLPIPEQGMFHLLDEIGIDSKLRMRAYLFLIKNPDMLRAFIGYPVEERKELLFTMMSNPLKHRHGQEGAAPEFDMARREVWRLTQLSARRYRV